VLPEHVGWVTELGGLTPEERQRLRTERPDLLIIPNP
jgi:hypothetical protein